MKIEFKESALEVDKTEDIILHGRKIGEMHIHARKEYCGRHYHAAINIRGGHLGLIQGHGETKEQAVREALATGRKEAETELVSIAELETELFGEA